MKLSIRSSAAVLSVLSLIAALLVGATGSAIASDATNETDAARGAISGKVMLSKSVKASSFSSVTALNSKGNALGNSKVAKDGSFTIESLRPGTYALFVNSKSDKFPSQFFGATLSAKEAKKFEVKADETTGAGDWKIDLTIGKPSGSEAAKAKTKNSSKAPSQVTSAALNQASGTVTAPAGTSLLDSHEISVDVHEIIDDGEDHTYIGEGEVNRNTGAFTVNFDLPSSSEVIFRVYDYAGVFKNRYYKIGQPTGVDDWEEATQFDADQPNLNNINFTLVEDIGPISGVVSVPGGESLHEEVRVRAWSEDGGEWDWWESTYVNEENGRYSFSYLDEDTDYKIQAYDESGKYQQQWYNNKSSLDDADKVRYDYDNPRNDVDFDLELGNTIKGTVSPISGSLDSDSRLWAQACIWEDDWGWCDWTQSTEVDISNGSYTVYGLEDGAEYRVSVYDDAGIYNTQWYNNATTVEDATSLSGDQSHTGINIKVTPTNNARISGKVTAAPGAVLDGELIVRAIPLNAEYEYDYYEGYVDKKTGNYTVTGLPVGSYKVLMYQDWSDDLELRDQWFSGKYSEQTATPVTLTAKQRRTGVNFTAFRYDQGAPGAPTGVSATKGNRLATVRWTAPTNTGNLPLTGFTARANNGRTCTASAGARSCNVTGLTPGSAYAFTVTAQNAFGSSIASPVTGSVVLSKLNQTLAKTKKSMKRKKKIKLPRKTSQKRAVKWKSLSKKICTVNSKGVVKAKNRKGTCKLQATATGTSQFNALKVKRNVKVK